MSDRRNMDIPWHLDDRQAALEAKSKFCAEIDAAGDSPSPCAEILREDISRPALDDVSVAISDESNHALLLSAGQTPTTSNYDEVTGAGQLRRKGEVAQVRQASSHESTIEPTPSAMATYNMFPKGSNGFRKEPKGVRMVTEPQRIFKNLRFFFFPDNHVNAQRFMRIRKAMEYGANLVHPWTTAAEVTHIIVDSDMQYEDVLKHVNVEELPDHIAVVNQRYPSDCISNQILVDPNQKLYDVRRRPRANSAKTRQMPQEEPTLVQETPIGKSKEVHVQKSVFLKTFSKAPTDENRAEVEAVEETPIRRTTAPAMQKAATPSAQKERKLLEHPNIGESQQIQFKIDTLEDEISKQRSNIFNAKIAVARSTEMWTEEMGIDDPDLISGLKTTVKDRLQRYEKEMTELEAQVIDLEKRRAELRKEFHEGAPVFKEQSIIKSAAYLYNDSFVDIIKAAKAVAHLPVDSDSEDDSITIPGDHDDDSDKSDDERPAKKPKIAGNSAFQCMEKHDGTSPELNPNAQTIEILEQMSKYYEGLGDQWRPRAYRMAIKTLKQESRKIISKDDAVRLPFVGARLAAKIEEIATTNRLRKLDNAKLDPVDRAIEIFRGIYGVGLSQATKWVNAGFRSLADLRVNSTKLTDNQRIGVEHYDDLQTRIPRAEVAEHGRIVKEGLTQLDPAFEVTIMGSYRRGASNSGDIDIIITKPGVDIQHIRHTVVGKLIPNLLKQGFLKFGLAVGDETSGSKWNGCSCLPTSKVWRRIDFLFVPYDEMGAALIYFTGNDIFNRSIRLLASKKGMRLNHRGLYRNVMRGKQRQKVTEGVLMEGKDERRIFEILGVPYRPPEHRIC
ncbi:DNA polymerase POL4 [Venturia nashicola]|nr:DNA polymerase POL4 [Venturia nashicola]